MNNNVRIGSNPNTHTHQKTSCSVEASEAGILNLVTVLARLVKAVLVFDTVGRIPFWHHKIPSNYLRSHWILKMNNIVWGIKINDCKSISVSQRSSNVLALKVLLIAHGE